MSFTDPSAEPAQTPEVQGSEAPGGGSPWEQHLTRFPDDLRDEAASVFKEMEGDFTKRFQDAATYRKQWEPYEQAGVNQLPPDQVAYGLQLVQAMNDPQVMQQWWNEYAQANNLQAPAAEPEVSGLDDFGFQDPQQLQGLIDQATGPLKQQLEQLQGHIDQQAQQQQEGQAMQYIEGQIAELAEKHGDAFDRDMAELYAAKYIESDPMNAVPRGWADWQAKLAAVEKAVLQPKLDAPNPAEGGGGADVTPPQFSGLNDPALKAAAMQHLRNDR